MASIGACPICRFGRMALAIGQRRETKPMTSHHYTTGDVVRIEGKRGTWRVVGRYHSPSRGECLDVRREGEGAVRTFPVACVATDRKASTDAHARAGRLTVTVPGMAYDLAFGVGYLSTPPPLPTPELRNKGRGFRAFYVLTPEEAGWLADWLEEVSGYEPGTPAARACDAAAERVRSLVTNLKGDD